MTVIHICNVADNQGTLPHRADWQFRNHYALPWEKEYGDLLQPLTYMAHVKLWKAAGMTKSRTRPIEACVQCHQIFQAGPHMRMRDGPPLAFITETSVWTRIELEYYLKSEWVTPDDWRQAAKLAKQMAELLEPIDK